MKDRTKRSNRALKRACLATAGVTILLTYSSCGGLGFGKRDDSDESAVAASEEPKKKRGGSLFKRAKNRNSWIDDDIQTTRRDRFAAQNNTDFGTTPDPAPSELDPVVPSSPIPSETPTLDLEPDPDPDPVVANSPNVTAGSPRIETPLRLPTDVEADPAEEPAPRSDSKPRVDPEGYTPLRPKLPGAEPIKPPE